MNFTRGDTYAFMFYRKNADKEIIDKKAEKLFFTVKKNFNTEEVLIQKTLENGITYDSFDFSYHVVIENKDTRDLPYGEYVYDIQVITEDYVATISKGKMILEAEATYDYE